MKLAVEHILLVMGLFDKPDQVTYSSSGRCHGMLHIFSALASILPWRSMQTASLISDFAARESDRHWPETYAIHVGCW